MQSEDFCVYGNFFKKRGDQYTTCERKYGHSMRLNSFFRISMVHGFMEYACTTLFRAGMREADPSIVNAKGSANMHLRSAWRQWKQRGRTWR